MNEKKQSITCLNQYRMPNRKKVEKLLAEEATAYPGKIVVLDDDPTGVQTVHDISVYTDWTIESIRAGFLEEQKMFFILTNSRGFTEEQTCLAHREIAERIAQVATEVTAAKAAVEHAVAEVAINRAVAASAMPYLIISRSDSTLRGHFPLETQVLKETLECKGQTMDGEILCPFFKEGGRYTLDNVHYVKYDDELIPAAQTEFAKDETFGYVHSNIGEYIEEKTKGAYMASECISISLEELRNEDYDGITAKLTECNHFQKVIVNAIDEIDVQIFSIALYRAMKAGKHFLLRCAAALVKAMGNVSSRPLLSREEMVKEQTANGGIIVVGSHTAKTTAQLEHLKQNKNIIFIEMNSDLVLEEGKLDAEVDRILCEEEVYIAAGKTVCVATKRALLKVENDTPKQALLRSVAISVALQRCVGDLKVKPSFIIAKGGITSSDVGTRALRVKRATVLGQIQPGIPVWKTGEESKFPGIPYVIFPGNVGDEDTLKIAAEILIG